MKAGKKKKPKKKDLAPDSPRKEEPGPTSNELSEIIQEIKGEPFDPESETHQGKIITENVITVIIQKEENPLEEIKELMEADIQYNREKFATIREHKAQDPDHVEEVNNTKHRRHTYTYMVVLLTGLVIVMPFLEIEVMIFFGALVTMIMAAVLFNARERKDDGDHLMRLLISIIEKARRK